MAGSVMGHEKSSSARLDDGGVAGCLRRGPDAGHTVASRSASRARASGCKPGADVAQQLRHLPVGIDAAEGRHGCRDRHAAAPSGLRARRGSGCRACSAWTPVFKRQRRADAEQRRPVGFVALGAGAAERSAGRAPTRSRRLGGGTGLQHGGAGRARLREGVVLQRDEVVRHRATVRRRGGSTVPEPPSAIGPTATPWCGSWPVDR